jgi:hypothetical protein
MAEIVAGFTGAGTTLAAARAATSAGFTGRHESTHRSELAELDRSLHRYRSASQSGSEMSFQEEDNFRENLNAYVYQPYVMSFSLIRAAIVHD